MDSRQRVGTACCAIHAINSFGPHHGIMSIFRVASLHRHRFHSGRCRHLQCHDLQAAHMGGSNSQFIMAPPWHLAVCGVLCTAHVKLICHSPAWCWNMHLMHCAVFCTFVGTCPHPCLTDYSSLPDRSQATAPPTRHIQTCSSTGYSQACIDPGLRAADCRGAIELHSL